MSEDSRTLWVGGLDDKVTEELIYELFLQTGPIDRLVFPTEGEGDEKKHKGHAYVVFRHSESVQYATQVLEGTSLYSEALQLKARNLPYTYKKAEVQVQGNIPAYSNRNSRYDNSSLRGGYNRGPRDDYSPHGRSGGYRNRGSNYSQGSYNSGGYNSSYNSQSTSGAWINQQNSSYNSNTSTDLSDKRQRLMNQQNILLQAHQQMQQGSNSNMYNSQQQANYQQQWNNYNQWNQQYQGYTQDQYNAYYSQQQ